LDETWRIKVQLNPNSVTQDLEECYLKAKKAGAIGGKVLGAGGGGFLLFWVPVAERDGFIRSLDFGVYVPFSIVFDGSTCIFDGTNN